MAKYVIHVDIDEVVEVREAMACSLDNGKRYVTACLQVATVCRFV
jgi:hypothetical protein